MLISFAISFVILLLFKRQARYEEEIWAMHDQCEKYSNLYEPRDLYDDQREMELYYECMNGGVE